MQYHSLVSSQSSSKLATRSEQALSGDRAETTASPSRAWESLYGPCLRPSPGQCHHGWHHQWHSLPRSLARPGCQWQRSPAELQPSHHASELAALVNWPGSGSPPAKSPVHILHIYAKCRPYINCIFFSYIWHVFFIYFSYILRIFCICFAFQVFIILACFSAYFWHIFLHILQNSLHIVCIFLALVEAGAKSSLRLNLGFKLRILRLHERRRKQFQFDHSLC